MKDIETMRQELTDYCDNVECCDKCLHTDGFFCNNHKIVNAEAGIIAQWHRTFFPEQYVIEDDPVNHPSHYTKGKIEVADFIADQKLNFDRGNAVKYVCRAGSKDPEKEVQDLEKAIWYISHEIKTLKGETENGKNEN